MNRKVRLFIAYRVISRLYFHLPVLFLLFWSLRITYFTATFLLAVYGLASTIAADLAPKIAERLTSSQLIYLGEGMKSLGLALILVGSMPGNVSLSALFITQLTGGIGFALALCADGALLRLVAVDVDPQEMGLIQALAQSLMFLSTLVGGFAGGILFDYEAHWPFYCGIFASLLSPCLS